MPVATELFLWAAGILVGLWVFWVLIVLLTGMYIDEICDEILHTVCDWGIDLSNWWRTRKEGKRMNSGGPAGSGAMYVRCAQCKAHLAPVTGVCAKCGPMAAIEYAYYNGSAGFSGATGGSATSNVVNYSTCVNCALPIPSGMYCGLPCLTNAKPGLHIPAQGCWDCGSPLAPTYHAGCTMARRVTGFLPIPGPAGSPGLTAAQAAATAPKPRPKTPIPVSGMKGYSEKGLPEDWDLALGTIRGYRWFKIDIPASWAGAVSREIRVGYYDATGKPEVQAEGMRDLSDEELPTLTGAYGGTWEDGVNEAECRSRTQRGEFAHQPPEIREACGCGFWAYFNQDIGVGEVLSSWSVCSYGDYAHPNYGEQPVANWNSIAVLGCVEGTGRVIVGEKGFRSQYAKIVAMTIGQVSVPSLMYWTDPNRSGYGRGPGGSYGDPRVQCSDDELMRRLTQIEDMLGRRYPSARIVSSENTLRKLYPVDNPYGES